MKDLRSIPCMLAGLLTPLGAGDVLAQAYPNKPIRIITLGVGTTNDFMARLVAQAASGPLGQQIIVENRAGSAIIPGRSSPKPRLMVTRCSIPPPQPGW